MVFMPNVTTNHAITYTNPIPCEQRFLSCMADPGRGLGGRPPLFLDQNEARRAEKIFLEAAPLSQGLDDRDPSLFSVYEVIRLACLR